MPEAADANAKSTSPRASSSRNILSRLSSPFSAKARTVSEFTVQAEDPHRRYSPGDVVKGNVVLKLTKAIRVTHIVLCLHGFVQVYRTPGVPPPEGFRSHHSATGKRRGSRKGEYFGNGFATLFEDEQVICGDGRLEEGNYRFDFEAKFPEETLPSSIEFERGAITYMVTATMTRPTSISPVMYHDQKITFAERIDIAKLLPPKPRTISLEPLIKRHGTRSPTLKRQQSAADTIRHEGGSAVGATSPSPSVTGSSATGRPQRSSSPSANSSASHRSSNPPASSSGSAVKTSRASETGSAINFASTPTSQGVVITATVESMKGGALRGDTIPLRILINHSKQIRSMHGVIVTLYRQARVDTHPALPIGPTTQGERRKFEDYYPKSLTGLGGLSLSGAGSSHMFRKDLSQITMPLIIHPTTLTAELTPKLRVPEDAFPTIACVPGAMISFKYYLEVVIDIQGKLSGTERYFSQSGYEYAELGAGDTLGQRADQGRDGSTVYKQQFIDTTALRRERSVIACILEIVIGTTDSDRRKDKQRATEEVLHDSDTRRHHTHDHRYARAHPSNTPGYDHWHDQQYAGHDEPWDEHDGYYDGYYNGQHNMQYDGQHGGQYGGRYGGHYNDVHDESYQWQGDTNPQWEQTLPFQPPSDVYDATISEKERLRRAEAALLPSEAPSRGNDDEHSTHVPSAPDMSRSNHGSAGAVSSVDGRVHASHAPRYSLVNQEALVPGGEEVERHQASPIAHATTPAEEGVPTGSVVPEVRHVDAVAPRAELFDADPEGPQLPRLQELEQDERLPQYER